MKLTKRETDTEGLSVRGSLHNQIFRCVHPSLVQVVFDDDHDDDDNENDDENDIDNDEDDGDGENDGDDDVRDTNHDDI